MPYDPMRDVREFHKKFSPIRTEATAHPFITVPILNQRVELIREEAKEVDEALAEFLEKSHYRNPEQLKECAEHLAKELADLLYVVYGTADKLGIPLPEVFSVVHQSNMSKVWDDGEVHYNSVGKVMKPPTYSPPDLSFIHGDRV